MVLELFVKDLHGGIQTEVESETAQQLVEETVIGGDFGERQFPYEKRQPFFAFLLAGDAVQTGGSVKIPQVFFAEDGVSQIQQDALEHFVGRGVGESERHYLRGADAQAQELDIAFGQAESLARAGGGDDGAVGYHRHSSSSTEAKRSSADISQKKR